MNFRVGQKVVCVNDAPDSFVLPGIHYSEIAALDGLTKGKVYTVRNVVVRPADMSPGIWLEEIYRPPNLGDVLHYGGECPFAAARFRPLVETDISIFQAMLVNLHREVEVAE